MAWNIANILIEAQKKAGGGGGTSDYSELSNKPQINSVTLSGNKSLSDLGIASASDVTDIQGLIPEDAATTNKLATADDLPGLATDLVPGLVQPDGTTVTINDGVISAVGGGGGGDYAILTTKEITKASLQYDSEGSVYYNPTNEFSAAERAAIYGANLVGVYVYNEDSSNARSWGDAVFSFKAITSGLHVYQIINDGAVANPHSTVGDIRIMIHGDSSAHLYYQILLKQTLYDYLVSDSKFVIKVVKIA